MARTWSAVASTLIAFSQRDCWRKRVEAAATAAT